MSGHKRILTAITVAILSVSIVAGGVNFAPAYAADSTSEICIDIQGSNVDANEYRYDRFGSPVYSYLTEANGGYMRVQGYDDTVDEQCFDVIYYDRNFNAKTHKQVKQDLPLFGAFAETQNNYFIVSGQENPDESDDCEVVRVTKYDKSWNRIGSCGLFGANTFIPFDGGSCRVAVVGEHLAIHTCHEMYEAGDGCHHQANMTLAVDSSVMEITYANYWVGGGAYVSHSFNQFIAAKDGKVAVLDHGDAYPRAISLTEFTSDLDEGEILSYTSGGGLLESIPGDTGDNDTGVSLGGFEAAPNGYLAAGNSIYQFDTETMDLSRPRNVFVSTVDTNEDTVATNWLTDVTDGAGNPQMVKVSDDCFVVLWSHGGNIEYVAVDGDAGRISEFYSAAGEISDCKPIFSDGKIIWYVYGGNVADFYEIPVSLTNNGRTAVLGQPEVITSDTGHDWQAVSVSNGTAKLRCSRCGAEKTDTYKNRIYMGYSLGNSTYTGYDNANLDIKDKIGVYGAYLSEDHKFTKTDAITVESDDPENCEINSKNNSVRFKDEGTYRITIRCKYVPSVSDYMTFYVTKPLESVELTAKPGSPQEYGTEVNLSADENGGRGSEVFTFTVTDSEGSETVLGSGSGNASKKVRTWTPDKPGTYTVKVSVYDETEPDIVVSDSLVYEVTKKAHPAEMPVEYYNYPFSSSVVIGNDLLGDAGKAGWEFESEDIGKVIEPGEEKTFSVHYNKEDRDCYITTDMEVTVVHSTCDHDKTEVRGAVKATCISEGVTGDEYCLVCGELIEASRPVPVDPDAHTGLRTIAAKKAGIMQDGNTEGRQCDDCGRIVKMAETIPGITDIYINCPDNAVYKGSAYYADIDIYAGDKTLSKGTDYKVSYSDNINAGPAKVKVIFTGDYEGESDAMFVIAKASNKLAVKGKTVNVKYSTVRKKSQTLAVSKVFSFTNKGQGTRTYAKASGNSKITINKKTGKVTVKKGLKKGTYTVKVKVKAAGTSNYKSLTRTVTIKVKVR